MRNGVGAWEVPVSQGGECTSKNHSGYRGGQIRARGDKRWVEKACPQGGFHLIWLAGDGDYSHLYLAGLWGGGHSPMSHSHVPTPTTTICVLKAIAINGDRNSYESLICQLVN